MGLKEISWYSDEWPNDAHEKYLRKQERREDHAERRRERKLKAKAEKKFKPEPNFLDELKKV